MAEKDEQIQTLQSAVEGEEEEELLSNSLGRFNNTKRFTALLEEYELSYHVTITENGLEDRVIIPEIGATSENGVRFHYTINAFFDEENDAMIIRVWNLLDFEEEDLAAVQRFCSELNRKWKWVKFYVDTADNSVSADFDTPMIDSPQMKDLMWESVLHLNFVIKCAYDELLPFRK